jgi:hypothetical protein
MTLHFNANTLRNNTSVIIGLANEKILEIREKQGQLKNKANHLYQQTERDLWGAFHQVLNRLPQKHTSCWHRLPILVFILIEHKTKVQGYQLSLKHLFLKSICGLKALNFVLHCLPPQEPSKRGRGIKMKHRAKLEVD